MTEPRRCQHGYIDIDGVCTARSGSVTCDVDVPALLADNDRLRKANARWTERFTKLLGEAQAAEARAEHYREALERVEDLGCGSRSAAFEAEAIARQALQEQSGD